MKLTPPRLNFRCGRVVSIRCPQKQTRGRMNIIRPRGRVWPVAAYIGCLAALRALLCSKRVLSTLRASCAPGTPCLAACCTEL